KRWTFTAEDDSHTLRFEFIKLTTYFVFDLSGPTTDFFDMVKGCNPKPDDQKEFISYNTDIVTVELSLEEWRKGVLLEYFTTENQSLTRHSVPTGTFNVIDTISNQKLRNLFCFLQVEASNSSVTSLEAETNLNVSDSVILKKYRTSDRTASAASLLISAMKILHSSRFSAMSRIKSSSFCDVKIIFSPEACLSDSSVHCTWKVIPTPDPASKEPGYIKLTVYGVASSVYNRQVCAELQLLSSDRRGNQKKF
ncbi:hypothetical protein ElyMa_001249200, partial [Elysia marginata]